MPQFSLRFLALVVSIFAIAAIALAQSTWTWLSIVATSTVFGYLLATSAAIASENGKRAFWVGFCVWAAGYLSLVYLVLDNENARSGTLITTKMLKSAHAAVVHEVPGPAAGGFGGGGFGGGGFAAPKAYRPEHDVFMQIGQLMWSWLSGVVGGYVTRFLYARALQSSAHNRRNATELSDAVSD